MLDGMTKREVFTASILTGILLGMIIPVVFLKYSLNVDSINTVIANSCINGTPKILEVYFFGKRAEVQCNDGETHNYNLSEFKKNSDVK